jgi:hypothetical protein
MSNDLDQSIVQTAGDLEALQRAVVAVLQTCPALAAVKILHEDDGDIENAIDAALSETGLNMIVLSPAGSSDSPDSAAVHLDDLDIVVRIIEIPIINRGETGTRIPINRALQLVATWLHQQIIAGHAITFTRFQPDPNAETPTKDVVFKTSLTLVNQL